MFKHLAVRVNDFDEWAPLALLRVRQAKPGRRGKGGSKPETSDSDRVKIPPATMETATPEASLA